VPSGLTLIEVLIAVAILGIGIAGLAAVLGQSARAGEASKRRLVALALAQSRIETALRVPYATLPIGTASEASIAGYELFGARIDVTQALPQVKGVAVTVTYPEGEVRLYGYSGNG
jgi:type IV pilus assembly protein PilV